MTSLPRYPRTSSSLRCKPFTTNSGAATPTFPSGDRAHGVDSGEEVGGKLESGLRLRVVVLQARQRAAELQRRGRCEGLRTAADELLPSRPALLTPLLSHSSPLHALSLYRRLLALPHYLMPESSVPVLLRLLARSRRHAHLSFRLLESLPSTHPHLLLSTALAVQLSTALSASAPGASFDAAVTCFDSTARVWARGGRGFVAAKLNALLHVFCARGRVAEARALFHRYCDAYPPDTSTFNTLLLGFKEAGHSQALDLFYHDAVLRVFVPDSQTRSSCSTKCARSTNLIHGA